MATSRVLLLAAVLMISTDVWGLRIMSFNVKQFGPTKFSNVEVVDQLVQVSYTARETLCCHYSHVHVYVCADIPPVRRWYTD